jgi:hypothetical protein
VSRRADATRDAVLAMLLQLGIQIFPWDNFRVGRVRSLTSVPTLARWAGNQLPQYTHQAVHREFVALEMGADPARTWGKPWDNLRQAEMT